MRIGHCEGYLCTRRGRVPRVADIPANANDVLVTCLPEGGDKPDMLHEVKIREPSRSRASVA
jgi:hypothetical protein